MWQALKNKWKQKCHLFLVRLYVLRVAAKMTAARRKDLPKGRMFSTFSTLQRRLRLQVKKHTKPDQLKKLFYL